MQEINLYDLMKHYARYWLLISLFTLAGFVAGVVYNNIQVPMYKSNATLILVDSTLSSGTKDPTIINNYIELLKSRRVLEPVIKSQKINQTYDELVNSISTSNEKDTEVVKLSITTKNPVTSKVAVDGAIESFKAEVKRLYGNDNIKVVDSASSSTQPYNVRKLLQLVLFTSAGFLVAIVIVFFIYDFNLSKPKSPKPQTTKKAKTASNTLTKKIQNPRSKKPVSRNRKTGRLNSVKKK